MCNKKNSNSLTKNKKYWWISYTSIGSLSLSCPLIATVHLTLPCVPVKHLHLSLPVLRHTVSKDDAVRMLILGCWKELERVQLLPAQWPLHQRKVWCETYSRATTLLWETTEHPPACKAQRNPSAPFDIPVLPFARSVSQHLCTCQILCDSCSSQVQQSCEFPSDITVVLMVSCFSSLSRVWQMELLMWGGKQMFCFVFQQTMMLFLQNDPTRKQNPSKPQSTNLQL